MLNHAAGALQAIIEGLKASPAFLALILLNVLVFGLIAWSLHEQRAYVFLLLERCFK